ncbi:STAS domain-containing protein [Planctomycetales bacterium ZRK34]|nr:STAS domain-containing protein [Planctomycetales bacterium ZRK34]
MQTLKIEIDDNDPRGLVVTLRGEGHLDDIADLQHTLQQVARTQPTVVVLNMPQLDFVSSMIIGAIIELRLNLKRHGGLCKIAGLRGHVAEAFHVTRIDEAIPSFATVEEALVN